MVLLPSQHDSEQGLLQGYISRQQTIPQPILPFTLPLQIQPTIADVTGETEQSTQPTLILETPQKKQHIVRLIVVVFGLALIIALYFTWRSDPPQPTSTAGMTQQNFASSTTSKNTAAQTPANGSIQVYIVGAVQRPGVYTLPANARMFQLLQAAGGTLPNANLVALNLAAKLSDGQEVYVTMLGERPPTLNGGAPATTDGTTPGQLININTASADEMRQGLRISSTTAQNIVNYRTQHGSFTSLDQLTQAISKTIYTRIKGQVSI